jgi:hypothetical protein
MKYIGLVLLFAIAVAIAGPSSQGGDDGYHSGHRHHTHRNRCATDFWGNCTYVAHHRYAYRWRYYHHRHHRYRRHHQGSEHYTYNQYYYPGGRERIDHGLQCHARRRVVGEEKSSRARAQRAADNAWMGSVRYDHGERYQDLNYGKDVRHNCGPSSTTTILKRTFFRCSIEATPCRAPVGDTTRVERKYEDDTPDDDDR